MITTIYIKGLIVLMISVLNNQFDTVYNKSGYTELSEQLTEDYQKIFEFSEKMRHYEVTQENFESFFQKGVKESLNFYQSYQYINQSTIYQLIKKKLMDHPDLKHPLNKPYRNNSKDLKTSDVLNIFSGEWSGEWKLMSVKHLWLSFKESNLKINGSSKIIGFQTCFTGDGFGWNYLIQKEEKVIILGYVYHFNSKGALNYGVPHYGFLNDYNQITWVSNKHVYHELVCNDTNCTDAKHYVITEIPYSKNTTIQFGTPIQAIYRSRISQFH